MSSGHTSFDHSVQEANLWLKAIATKLHFEERRFAPALRAVLPCSSRPAAASRGMFQVVFDQLDPGETAKVIDQLPIPLRVL